jgi:putative DNA primase/helicase
VDTFKTACHKNTVRVGTEKIALGRMRSNGARYDADPSLLNCPSGIIDLRLGSRFDHNPEFYLTYMANVDPVEGPTPYYDKFMKDIFLGDKDLIEYYKCLKGYSLTGETKEHKFIVLYGDGGNGKSTDLKLEKDMLGTSDYAPDNYGKKYFQTNRADSLLAKNGLSDDKGNDIAVLHKCRFCSVSELGEQKIKGERLKALASGDELQIRLNYQEFYNSTLQVKIWIQTNFKPNIRGDDEAIWRRAILIPFKANFRDNPDKDLSAKLRSEAPAVLAERIRYAKQWYKMGLPDMPSSLTAELDTWRSGADPILQFTQDCIVKTGHGDVLNSEIHAAYVVWCRQSGIEPLPMQKVSERMLALGFEKGQFYRKGMNLQRGFKNIALVAKAIEYDADEI